ncbi:MAG: CBS domain-containing protein [Acidimicrobiia bacterium]
MDVARRRVCSVDRHRSVDEVARLMVAEDVHAIVVVDEERAVGIVTDRDLVTRIMAPGLPADTPVGSVMTVDPVTADSNETVDTVQMMLRHHGIRQVPLTEAGLLVGIVALDDLVYELTAELRRLLPEAAAAIER